MKTPQPQRVQALCLLSACVLLGTWLWLSTAGAQERSGVLRIGMTAADIPFTGGIPDQGFEGYRFIGYPLYEALIHWDLSQGGAAGRLGPWPRGVVGGAGGRSDQMDLHAAPWRQVS